MRDRTPTSENPAERLAQAEASLQALRARLAGDAAALEGILAAEDALRQSELNYRVVAENTYDWEFWIGADGRYLYVSPSCRRITGHAPEEFLADPHLRQRIVHPDDLPRFQSHIANEGTPQAAGEVEFRIVRPDGAVRWVGHVCEAVVDEQGSFLGMRGSNRDITERKTAEQEVASLARFPGENPNPVLRISKDGLVLYSNQAAQPLLEALGHAEGRPVPAEWRRRVADALASGRSQQAEAACDGSVWSLTFAPVAAYGYANVYGLDVTERAETQRRLERTQRALHKVAGRLEARVQSRTAQLSHALESLRESEGLFRATFEQAAVGMGQATPDGRLTRVNHRFCEMLGYSGEELLQRTFQEITHPDDRPEDAENVPRLLSGEIQTYAAQKRLFRKDGGVVWASLTASLVRGEGGEPRYLIAVIEDISARKQAELRIKATNDIMQLFLRATSRKAYLEAAVGLLSEVSGCPHVGIRMLNERGDIPYEASVGFDRGFLESECWLNVTRDRCACTRVVAGRPMPQDAAVMTAAGSFCCGNTFEFVNALSDQERADFRGVCIKNGFASVAVVPIRYQDTTLGAIHLAAEEPNKVSMDNVEFVESISPLIGEAIHRINTEEALRAGEERLRAVVTGAPVIVWSIDRAGVYTLSEGTGLAALGLKPGELVGQSIFERTRDTPEIQEHVNRALAGEDLRKVMVARGHAWDSWYSALRDTRGEIVGVIGVSTDITDRKEAEDRLRELNVVLAERAAQLRQLALDLTRAEQRERRRLAEVLHDHLQQLLAAAKLRVNMLDGSVTQETVKRSLRQVVQLLEDSIRASRTLTAELNPPVLQEAGLAAALEWLGRQMHANHGLAVEVKAETDAGPETEDVGALLFQCVRELLFNVVKHAEVKAARVEAVRTGDGQIRIEVSDEGAGFDASQAAGAGSPESFGFPSIRQRLHLLGGRMEVESAPGRGCRVRISAPVDLAGKAAPPAPPRAAGRPAPRVAASTARGKPPAPGPKIRVLLADDHKMMREGLAALLRRQDDIEMVGEAYDGETAVRLARELAPNVVIMDVTMPTLNGIEATRRIVAEMPGVNVIGLSMHEEADMASAMREAGAVDYLTKDGPSDALVTAIRACGRHGGEPMDDA